MTDYFALLDHPRRPWLDAEELKQTFHAKTLRQHPDAQSSGGVANAAAFTELNEAYQVLRDPKRRLQHLLILEEAAPSSLAGATAPEIETLFPAVADLTHRSEALLQKLGRADSILSRSLLKSELISANTRLDETLKKLGELSSDAEARLRQLTELRERSGQKHHAELKALYLQFSYLTKWTAQLGEKRLQLASVG